MSFVCAGWETEKLLTVKIDNLGYFYGRTA